MAPNLAAAQHAEKHDMIVRAELLDSEMAKIAQCTDRTIRRHGANLRCFGSTTAPQNRSGRRSLITSSMLTALCEHLAEKPDEDLDGMVLFVLDKFGELRSHGE